MKLSLKHRSVGLDVGSASAKAVTLVRQGRQTVIQTRGALNIRAEGVLNESELFGSVSQWLKQLAWAGAAVDVGLPQFMATTQLSDFPAAAKDGLDEMVAYETRQLAGLSGESFIHGYAVMPPNFGRQNPVLIGICRESVVRDRVEALQSSGIVMSDLCMNGLATVNALFELYPEARSGEAPQLVLDIGAENATLSVCAGGQVLFVSSLMFGADRYTEGLVKELRVDTEEAEKQKQTSRLDPDDVSSALFVVTRHLVQELHTAVEHWRAQERGELAEAPFCKIWLCGGGAQLGGLADYLGGLFECPAQVFGPLDYETGQEEPVYTTAFGLALQGLRRAAVPVSLSPPELRWALQRTRRFGYLVAAAVIGVAFLASLVLRSYTDLSREQRQVEAQIEELRRCEGLIPRLEDTLSAIHHYEKVAIPFVARGNQARRFVTVLSDLGKVCGDKDWFVYLADEKAYQSGKATAQGKKPRSSHDPAGGLPGGLLPGQVTGVGDADIPPPFAVQVFVEDLNSVESVIVAGYTLLLPEKPYEPVREIVRRLNESDAYTEVDLLPEVQRIGREDIFMPWVTFFRKHPVKRYKAFTMRVPFIEQDVLPAVEEKADEKQ